ncbi:MAG: cell division protein SepF [Bacillota bacterium]|nr:cell division protein SepF [Bacillota bacterium]
MGLFSALRRKAPEEDLYEDYEDNYEYEEEQAWEDEGVQPIHSVADMRVVVVQPREYKDASRVADHLRDMKFVVLNLGKTDHDVARRLLDFVSGVIFSENGHIMKVATNVYVVAPYFVELKDISGESKRGGDLYF